VGLFTLCFNPADFDLPRSLPFQPFGGKATFVQKPAKLRANYPLTAKSVASCQIVGAAQPANHSCVNPHRPIQADAMRHHRFSTARRFKIGIDNP